VVANLGSAHTLIDADKSSIPPDTEFVCTLSEAIEKIEGLAQGAAERATETPNSRAA
jgi:hypothetical protein